MATTGSVLAARTAGITTATSEATHRVAATPLNVKGSLVLRVPPWGNGMSPAALIASFHDPNT